jgi:glycosyl transferase, family 25
MKAYVINLPESIDKRLSQTRRRHMAAQLARAGLDHQFVASVDPALLTPDERACAVDEAVVAHYWGWLKPGVLGASLSHAQAYREILEGGDSAALVLEDDVTLERRIGSLLEDIANRAMPSEIILLYWRSKPGCELSAYKSQEISGCHRLMFPMDPHKMLSACAYVITREACETMLRTVLPVRTGADAWGEFHDRGGFQTMRCVVPTAVSLQHNFKSTLDYIDPSSAAGRLASFIAHKRIFPVYQVLGLRRARREQSMSRYTVTELPSTLVDRSVGAGRS